ncbi:hypothetical protein CR513_00031, partial [Mucuna pruriens]
MRLNSHSYQERSNSCGSTREDQDARTIPRSTPKKQKTKRKWCATNVRNQDISNLNKPFIKNKKSLMTTWENLDLSLLEDEDEEANLCIMADTTYENKDDGVPINNFFQIYQLFLLDTKNYIKKFQNYLKFGRRSYDCRECLKGLKKIWVPKTIIIPIAYVFNNRKKIPVDSGSNSNNLNNLDPEIDRTLHRLRKIQKIDIGSSDSFNSISDFVHNSFATNFEFPDCSNISFFIKSKHNYVENKSKELEYKENQDQTLKELAMSNVVYQPWCIQYSPPQALKEFHVVCSKMRPKGLVTPTAGSFPHLGDMKSMFLEKFFLASKTATIWKKICGIRQ